MLCIEHNQLIEDAATGSASTCLQAFLLQYHKPAISMINNQGNGLIDHRKFILMVNCKATILTLI
jgi:predicted PhzF superfamily epimerase YddE/YHI9